jgi:hypothetical protein
LLLVLGTAVAVAVAHRVRERSRVAALGLGGGWAPYREPTATPPSEAGPSAAEPAEEAPTAAPATVVATMEATSPAPVARPFDGNGSVVAEPVAAPAGDGSAGTTTPAEHVVSPVALPKRRGSGVTLAALAALTGVGAITLGAWGIATSVADDDGGGTETTAALENVQQVVSLIAKPTTTTIPLQGSGRRIILVVGARGYGVLVLNGVSQPPPGKTYQAWVIRPDVKAPASAGIFPGGTGVVQLTRPVPPGAVVAITVEPAGGSVAPTQQPKLVATRT